MAQLMRGSNAASPIFARASQVATRGGGGSWHRPDLKPYPEYKNTRRIHLEDVNTILYSDIAPEFHMHLHSMWVQSSKQAVALWFGYIFVIIMPVLWYLRAVMAVPGPNMFISVRAGEQHTHMYPKIYHHLKTNNCEAAQDKVCGRMNASFYKNWARQENGIKFSHVEQMEKHF